MTALATSPTPAKVARHAARRAAWREFRRSPLALPGLILFVLFVVGGVFAPWLAPYSPTAVDLANLMAPPSWQHWFGTDELGRDLFSRIVYGARISLLEGLLAVTIAAGIGVPLGIVSGYAGKTADTLLMRCIDVLLAFPGVLLAIVIISILGSSLFNAILAVAIYSVPIFARFARGSTLALKEEPYIEACRAIGMSHWRTLSRHIFPNIAPPIFALATLRVGIAILTCASLSFLGLGAQPPMPEWGAMLAQARTAALLAPHLALFPGLAIILLVLSINMLHDGLQRVLDPKARRD